MEPGQMVMTIIALLGTGVICYGGIAAIQVLVRHYGGGPTGPISGELAAELRDMRARIEDGEQARERIAELEERLDFAERLLAQQREAAQLPPRERR